MKNLFLILLIFMVKAVIAQNTFPPNGNVGIGTDSPRQKLDVNGKASIRGAGTIYNNPESADLQIGYGIASAGTLGAVSRLALQPYGHTGGPWKFDVRDDEASAYLDINYGPVNALTIHHGGNIGIGTSTPQEKLSVNGNIRAREIKVETASWPDYVFEENYKIFSLSDLKKYIRIHKHLPDMPSAKEVEVSGLALGEMNKQLLKKVEELTLHLIEKDNQMQVLLQRIENIENKLK